MFCVRLALAQNVYHFDFALAVVRPKKCYHIGDVAVVEWGEQNHFCSYFAKIDQSANSMDDQSTGVPMKIWI